MPEDTTELKGRALRAAAAMYDEFDLDTLGPKRGERPALVTLIAAGWIQGWYDGGQEAVEIVKAEFSKFIEEQA